MTKAAQVSECFVSLWGDPAKPFDDLFRASEPHEGSKSRERRRGSSFGYLPASGLSARHSFQTQTAWGGIWRGSIHAYMRETIGRATPGLARVEPGRCNEPVHEAQVAFLNDQHLDVGR